MHVPLNHSIHAASMSPMGVSSAARAWALDLGADRWRSHLWTASAMGIASVSGTRDGSLSARRWRERVHGSKRTVYRV